MDPLTIAMMGASALKGVSSFFGSNKSSAAAQRAQEDAAAAYAAGISRAKRDVNASSATASGFIQPYAQRGGRAADLYANAIGVNGRPAQEAFYTSFLDDPGFNAELDAGRRQIEHSATVQGYGNSGAIQKELFDFGRRSQRSAFNDRLDRLAGLGSSGFEASGRLANIEQDRGRSIADLTLAGADYGASSIANIGSIRSSGIANRANIIGDTVGSMVSAYGMGKGMRRF